MPQKPQSQVSSVGSQRDDRYPDTFYDQHRSARFPNGRPWNGNREMAANKGDKDGFIGTLSPGDHTEPFTSGWTAPWYPEQRFFKYNHLRNKITIDYPAMRAHDAEYSDKYYSAAAIISYEKGWEPTREGTLPQFTIRKVLGNPPRSPKIAEAAMAGDPWLLGFSNEPNAELATLLGISMDGLREAYAPPLTPGQVLSAHPYDVQELIDNAVAEALKEHNEAMRIKKEKDAAKMAKARAARKIHQPTDQPLTAA